MTEFAVGIDVGGTFTDLFAIDRSSGRHVSTKVPSSKDVTAGILDVLGRSEIRPGDVTEITHGSTVATNALVERTVAPVGLLATKGFRDVLETRRLWRQHLFGHTWDRPKSLVPRRLRREISERIDWTGKERLPLAEDDVRREATFLVDRGATSIAISFLFSFLEPKHEERAAEIVREMYPDVVVTLSSEVDPQMGEYERTSTTVVAASLKPLVDRYLDTLEAQLGNAQFTAPVRIMKSNGGVMSAGGARMKPAEIIRSGPVGGIAFAVGLGRQRALPNIVTVDIGGTTADVGVVLDGTPSVVDTAFVDWDLPIRVPMIDVRSVGAGGGSVAWVDHANRFHVGPKSAGATPGPACYGRGGSEPTVTDAAVVTGLIDPNYFLGGDIELDARLANEAVARIGTSFGWGPRETGAAIIKLATANMAELVREVTLNQGHDPRDFVLVAFGGAGPLFGAALAAEIGIGHVIVPRETGVLSACGGVLADVVHDYAHSFTRPLNEVDVAALEGVMQRLRMRADDDLFRDGSMVDASDVSLRFVIDVRYRGQTNVIAVPLGADAFDVEGALRQASSRFVELHEQYFGHRRVEDPLELTTVRLMSVRQKTAGGLVEASDPLSSTEPVTRRAIHLHDVGEIEDVPVLQREQLPAAFEMKGPFIVQERQSTTIVPPNVSLRVQSHGELDLRMTDERR